MDEYLEGIMNHGKVTGDGNVVSSDGPAKKLFPAMVNPIIIPDDLAKEFLEWAYLLDLSEYKVAEDGPEIHVCNRMVSRIEQQLKLHGRDGK